MKQIDGDLWKLYQQRKWICIPTNGSLKDQNTKAVMGKGLALAAAERFPTLPLLLASRIKRSGTRVEIFVQLGLFAFPTKDEWFNPSKILLILTSARELIEIVNHHGIKEVYLPRVGCGAGGLRWAWVSPELGKVLDDRFTIVHNHEDVS